MRPGAYSSRGPHPGRSGRDQFICTDACVPRRWTSVSVSLSAPQLQHALAEQVRQQEPAVRHLRPGPPQAGSPRLESRAQPGLTEFFIDV